MRLKACEGPYNLSILLHEAVGYSVARSVFTEEEVESLREHFMALRAQGEHPGDFGGLDLESTDPLKRFPRMIHMHRWDDVSFKLLVDSRIKSCLTYLLGEEPYPVQTMLYFKPAGARGQALHQDNFYLKVQPGTCIASWLALDPCDEENGCMQVVPGTQDLEILCTERADTKTSFTDVTVPLPRDREPVPVRMNAGDVLFFNGSLIHGSYPNTSKNRFRRSFIGHYVNGSAETVGQFFHPVIRFDGSEVDLGISSGGSQCGVWKEVDGRSVVELVDDNSVEGPSHE